MEPGKVENMKGKHQLCRFREILYQNLDKRADATLNLIDALSGNTAAASVAELSLSPQFERGHSSVYAAVKEFALSRENLGQVLKPAIPQKGQRAFRHISLDTTPHPRPYAHTLSDRTMVYQPTVVRGNKPLTIGHKYSYLFLHPEREQETPPWVVPLAVQRVKSDDDAELLGGEQLLALLPDLPFDEELTVCTADTAYSKPEFLLRLEPQEKIVTIVRVRSNRTFYRRYQPAAEARQRRGHPRWYGDRMKLNDPTTYLPADREVDMPYRTRRGKPRILRIRAWQEMVMRGKKGYRMHQHPFTLVSYERLTPDGQPVYRRPVWLIIFGRQRHEIDAKDGVDVYIRRFDAEHFFRFGKRRLLMIGFQTPDVHSEENWHQVVQLAYVQLWLARDLTKANRHPWQRHLAAKQKGEILSPTQVQRDFSRIIQRFGTPARSPKPRGKSPGRAPGIKLVARRRFKVVKKTKMAA